MTIAPHSIRSFSSHFSETYRLIIHTDPSIDEKDIKILRDASDGIQVDIVSSIDRKEKLKEKINEFPKTKELLAKGSYFTKLEVAMFEEPPYFFFDSDIIWLKHVPNLQPNDAPNVFSTESWSSYSGIAKPWLWIRNKTPRRVNSGFYFTKENFPYQKLEDLLNKGMYNNSQFLAGDQEIFAYLYSNMKYYHPEDMKRSRVGSIYQLNDIQCAALHFPGRMWSYHLDQIEKLKHTKAQNQVKVRFQPAIPLSYAELLRMRAQIQLGRSELLAKPLNVIRKLLRKYR